MKRVALVIMLVTILSKFLGFIRDVILSYYYGASNMTDAYLISQTIPLVIFSFIGTGIATSFIPIYSEIVNKQSNQDADKFTSNVTNVTLFLCTIIIILTSIFSNTIVKIFASGFSGDTLQLAITFTRISIWGIYFYGMVFIYNAYLQLKGNFIIPASVGIVSNLILFATIIISVKHNIMILSIGSVIAMGAQFLLLVPFVIEKKFKYRLVFNLRDKNIKKMIFLSIPVIIGVSVNQINVLVDRTIASTIVEGGISALNYASRLNGFFQGVFGLSVATAMYPMISKMVTENNLDGLKKSVSEAISYISFFIIPITVGAMIFAEPIVKLLFGRGAFSSQAITMTSYALFYYSIGMVGVGLREVLSRAFYSLQDTRTPMINASIAVVINIALNIILSRYMGIGGLALATSISAIFSTLLLLKNLRKKIGSLGLKKISSSLVKILFASIIMGLITKTIFGYLISVTSHNLSLLIAILIGVITYFVMIYYLRINEVNFILYGIIRKLKKLNN